MNMADQPPKDLIGFLDYYLVTKAPFQLPMAAKEAIVKYGPWIAIVLLALGLPAILVVLGIGALFAPFAGAQYATAFTYTTIFLIVILGLEIAALPGLFARKMQGWRFIFYARLVAIVSSLVSGLIINAIIGGLISLYILFQVRPLYEGRTEPATPAVQG
jgi:hypothetical protein